MPAHFVDTSAGNDANDGLDNCGAGLATATWTEGTLTLTQAGHGYTFATGDVIYISAGTGATVGLYEVVSSTANDIVLAATSSLPGVADGNDFAAGDLATGDITSSDGPDATLQAGENAISAGENVWVRATATYSETCVIGPTLGTTTNPEIWEGYTTTLGDDGQVTIDGGSARASAFTDSVTGNAYLVFKNFIIQTHTSHGVDFAADMVRFLRCDFLSNGGSGVNGDNDYGFQDCRMAGNSGDGVTMDLSIAMHGCLVETNTGDGVLADTGCIAMTDMFSNAADNINMGVINTGLRCILCNTLDGDGNDSNIGINFSTAFTTHGFVINNVIYDCTKGAEWIGGEMVGSSNNLLASNGDNYGGTAGTWDDEVTSAPVFNNEAGGDRRLGSGSPAIGTGTDAAQQLGVAEEISIGAFQVAAGAGGSGGLLVHPGTSGGARA